MKKTNIHIRALKLFSQILGLIILCFALLIGLILLIEYITFLFEKLDKETQKIILATSSSILVLSLIYIACYFQVKSEKKE